MDITGRLIQLLPDVEGDSPRGHWVRGGFVIETDGEYPRKVAFTAFGEERVAMAKNIPMGSPVQVTFNPESREFNEKWYTDLRASRIQPFVPGQMPTAASWLRLDGCSSCPCSGSRKHTGSTYSRDNPRPARQLRHTSSHGVQPRRRPTILI